MSGRHLTSLAALFVLGLAATPATAGVDVTFACGSTGIQSRLCDEAAKAWSAKTGNTVKIVAAPQSTSEQLALYQQFLHIGESGLAAFLNVIVGSRFMAPEGEKDNFGARMAERMFDSRLTLVTRQLGQAPMMAGDVFTAADISVVYGLGMAERLGLAHKFGPEIADYRTRMFARQAFQRASAKWSPPGQS